MTLLTGVECFSQPRPGAYTEYQLKAAFLYNFTQFIEWPSNAFTSADAPLVIGVLGDDPFGAVLNQTVEGETIRGRLVSIRRFRRVEDVGGCQLLFISRSEKGQLPRIQSALQSKPVVTVSDMDQFVRHDGVIGFVLHENKIRFEINLDSANRAGVKISSKLIKLAFSVHSDTRKERD